MPIAPLKPSEANLCASHIVNSKSSPAPPALLYEETGEMVMWTETVHCGVALSFLPHHPLIRADKLFGLLNKPWENQLTNLHLCRCVNKILVRLSLEYGVQLVFFLIYTVKVDLASCRNNKKASD